MSNAEQFRSEFDEFRDYLNQPVGETVARLCATLRLDPTSCVDDGGTWMVRSPPHEHEAPRNPITGSPIWSDGLQMPDLSLPSSVGALAATGPPP